MKITYNSNRQLLLGTYSSLCHKIRLGIRSVAAHAALWQGTYGTRKLRSNQLRSNNKIMRTRIPCSFNWYSTVRYVSGAKHQGRPLRQVHFHHLQPLTGGQSSYGLSSEPNPMLCDHLCPSDSDPPLSSKPLHQSTSMQTSICVPITLYQYYIILLSPLDIGILQYKTDNNQLGREYLELGGWTG